MPDSLSTTLLPIKLAEYWLNVKSIVGNDHEGDDYYKHKCLFSNPVDLFSVYHAIVYL